MCPLVQFYHHNSDICDRNHCKLPTVKRQMDESLTTACPSGDRWLTTVTPIHWLLLSSPERCAVIEPNTYLYNRPFTNNAPP